MPISPRDRKILWSRSGNVCAFPGCDQELVQPGDTVGDGVVVGDEAHIIARVEAGPRGAPEAAIDVDSCVNIVLLCPTHHRIVDAQPEVYTTRVLQAMKFQHETAVRARQRLQAQSVTAGARAFDVACGGLRAAGAWRVGPSLVLACSYGSDPVLTENHHWRGSGLNFRHVHDSLGSEVILDSSEAEPDIEYWLDNSAFTIIQSTYEPVSNAITPFVEHRFALGLFPAIRRARLLLSGSVGSQDDLSSLLAQLRSMRKGGPSDAEALLYRIRNAGLNDPGAALAAIESLDGLWWFDGCNAEAAHSIARELSLIRNILSSAA